jgi:hypothetical protein
METPLCKYIDAHWDANLARAIVDAIVGVIARCKSLKYVLRRVRADHRFYCTVHSNRVCIDAYRGPHWTLSVWCNNCTEAFDLVNYLTHRYNL